MKYGKDITDKICNSIIELKGRVNACKEAGISFETFCQWMKDEKKPEFSEYIQKAEQECLIKGQNIAIQSIFKAMPTSWQAGAWWLERNFKSKYALRHEFTGKDGEAIKITAFNYIPPDGDSNSQTNGQATPRLSEVAGQDD